MKYESYCFLTPALSGSSSEGHVNYSILSQLAPLACLFLFYFTCVSISQKQSGVKQNERGQMAPSMVQ